VAERDRVWPSVHDVRFEPQHIGEVLTGVVRHLPTSRTSPALQHDFEMSGARVAPSEDGARLGLHDGPREVRTGERADGGKRVPKRQHHDLDVAPASAAEHQGATVSPDPPQGRKHAPARGAK
jgi:hypothetical protein